MFVSATKVREIALLGGPVEKFVKPAVAAMLGIKLKEFNDLQK
jgi:phosphopantetheine adenylyltransferase